MRVLLYEAAQVLLTVARNSWLNAWAMYVAERAAIKKQLWPWRADWL
ncbi:MULTISPECIES: hypothetical protein [unclassified Sinorhizobium]|nr:MULTISPECIES: hypothetical protein [unclassified Sinorhizobium]MDK1376571.1 hypothetical protein [Sinorhizobium sp. 6-70]MDK1481231.1 hypothetical protein [Sinorhizobium sp. 6-117]